MKTLAIMGMIVSASGVVLGVVSRNYIAATWALSCLALWIANNNLQQND